MDETRARGIANNQALFREVNEYIERAAGDRTLYLRREPVHFLCECGDSHCSRTIPLLLAEYEPVRAHPARFVVLRGHEIAEVEEVVERHDRYFVVQKLGAGEQQVVEADPRS